MKKLKRIFTIAFVLLAFTLTTNVNAQGNGGGTSNNDGQHNDTSGSTQTNGASTNNNGGGSNKGGNNAVPLDGGLSILLAGAAFFGIKKLRQK